MYDIFEEKEHTMAVLGYEMCKLNQAYNHIPAFPGIRGSMDALDNSVSMDTFPNYSAIILIWDLISNPVSV